VAEIVADTEVAADAAAVWAALVDWPTHGAWMLFTTVEPTTDDTDGVGAGITGITRLGPLVVRDTMVVTQWQPPPAQPARCVVDHTGKLVRGAGAFEVEALGDHRSRVIWSEWVRLPFGLAGEAGWLVAKPVVGFFLRRSLRRLAALVEAR